MGYAAGYGLGYAGLGYAGLGYAGLGYAGLGHHAAGYASVSPSASVNIAGLAPAAVPVLEDFMLELDVMLPTLLEPSMSPRERLMLTLTTLLDTVWDTPDMDMLVLDTPDLDTLVSDTPDLDMLAWDTMLLAMPVSLPLPL